MPGHVHLIDLSNHVQIDPDLKIRVNLPEPRHIRSSHRSDVNAAVGSCHSVGTF
jgi:hypothetical protein